MSKLYFDADVDIGILKSLRVAVVGYGNQGRAHALNLKDSGIDVSVALRADSSSIEDAREDGVAALEIEEAVRVCDVISLQVPDQTMSEVYETYIERHLKPGKMLLFSHGYNIHYKQIVPPHFIDIGMVAPSGPGYAVRQEYINGRGVPTLVAVKQDVTGRAQDIVLAYSKAIGGTRLCCFSSNFKEETETDLFGEQIILTGILPSIIDESLKVLLESGYSPTVAWFVCFYEVRNICELISKMGIEEFYKAVSDTAEYGGMSRSKMLLNKSFVDEMRSILSAIQSGDFHEEWQREAESGYGALKKMRESQSQSPINRITSEMLSILKKKNEKT